MEKIKYNNNKHIFSYIYTGIKYIMNKKDVKIKCI